MFSFPPGSPDKKSSSSDELKLKEAMGNLAAGKRNLLINDVSGAVSSFAEACKVGNYLHFDLVLFHWCRAE